MLLFAFREVAARLTARHLTQQAGALQATLQAGRSPWQWRLRSTDDLIAGRAFGAADVTQVPGGLRVVSRDGSAFELGWPIDQGLDLAHWPVLAVERAQGEAASLTVVWQHDEEPSCWSRPFRWQKAVTRIELRRLQWESSGATRCELPSSVKLLRLRVTLPRGAALTLRGATLERATSGPAPSSNELTVDPARWPSQRLALATAADAAPIVPTPPGASAEQMLAWRDRIVAIRPAALVVAAGTAADLPVGRPHSSAAGWLLFLAYAVALGWLAIRPAGSWLTLAAATAGPLWVLAGLQWGLRAPVPGALAFAAAIGFAGWTSWRQRPHRWHWLGAWRTPSWWLPFALIPAAATLCLLWGQRWTTPLPRHALTYLGWAALQQWLILAFVLPRLEALLPARKWAVLGAALVFAALHTPNGLLMQLCFAAELWWAWCFTRSRSLLPIAVAHAACALTIGAGLAGQGLRSLEVSARFFL